MKREDEESGQGGERGNADRLQVVIASFLPHVATHRQTLLLAVAHISLSLIYPEVQTGI